MDDQNLANRIEDQSRRSLLPPQSLRDVTIRVRNGAAYVQGWVGTQAEREAIDSAVEAVKGITAVYDQLQLS